MLADGQEVLVVDGDSRIRKGLDQLLTGAGLAPTLVADPVRALELAAEKFFSVAVVDLDTPTQDMGLPLVGQIRERSPATVVVVMAARKTFDVAVDAFRAGAIDVILKAPEQVQYLKERVVAAATEKRRAVDNTRTIEDVLAFHEDLMKVTLETHRRAAELEERLSGNAPPVDETAILVVDPDGHMQTQLAAMMKKKGGYRAAGVTTGGEALDLIGRERYQIFLVRDTLPDLPGTMVVRSIKQQLPEAIVLFYTAPSDEKQGAMEVFEGSRAIPFLPEFGDPAQIMARIDELRDAFHAKTRERRYLASFRQHHFDLLKRYAQLRERLQRSNKAELSAASKSPTPRPIPER